MTAIFDFLQKMFGLDSYEPLTREFQEKLATYFTIMTILVAVMIVVAVVLLIVVIVLGVKAGKNKKQIAALQANGDSPELRNKIRSEIEPIVRREIEVEYKDKMPKSVITDEQYERLKKRLDEKDAQIQELGRALEQANAATHAISTNANSSELHKTVSDLTLQNSLLTEQNSQYHAEISELQAEIAKLKEQKGKQQVAAQKAKQAEKAAKEAAEKAAKEAAEKAAKEAAEKADKPAKEKSKTEKDDTKQSKKPVKEAAATTPAPEPEPEVDEDEEDEYDNEFGDENSDVKVTLKFERSSLTWVVLRSDSTRTVRRLQTKQEALPIARDLAKRLHAQLVVHKRDGKFQKV